MHDPILHALCNIGPVCKCMNVKINFAGLVLVKLNEHLTVVANSDGNTNKIDRV